jgi:hypothetical protein
MRAALLALLLAGCGSSRAAEPHRHDHELIARARARGAWTAADRDELRATLRHATETERRELLRGLARAMNEGELVLDGIKAPH